ncbi:MAG TPA: ATP-binding protein [Stellaceae bacterium]|nr:ATP-binding protein [Stellaceae bacterium]
MPRQYASPQQIDANDPVTPLGTGFDNHPSPIFVYDEASLRFLAANASAVRFYGYGRTKFRTLGMADLELPEPDGLGRCGIGHHRKADGTIAAMRVATSRIEWGGRPAILVTAIDVSDLEQALLDDDRRCGDLRESERRYRHLFEAAADYAWEYDSDHRLVSVSPVAVYEAIYGAPVARFLGKRASEHIGPEMGAKALAAIKARLPFRDVVFSVRRPDGTLRWVSVSGAPTFAANGDFLFYRGVGADITTRIEAEVAARLAQRRLHDAVAHVSQPFVIYDAADHAVAFNQAFADLYRGATTSTPVRDGVSARELAEWKLRHDFYVDAATGQKPDLETLVARYQTGGEHAYRLRDGRFMLVTYRPLPGGNRVGLWTDITALKRAEEERRDLEAQLHHSQRLEALGTLAGGVAHELNNTLVPVIALTKRVAAKLPEESRERANLETVMTASERARELVQEILTFSRKQQLRHEGLGLARIAEDALKMMRGALPATILVETAIAPVPPLLGDPGQLHQMIVNLVTNAAQAIGTNHGTIKIALGVDADRNETRFSVADNGCGMDEATRARIFEPFFTTKPVGQATGLGLAAVRGIVTSHGGRIEVTSEPGQGTRVEVVFPVEAV